MTSQDEPTDLASQSCLPGSITKCEKVLRTIKIAIGEYFDVVKRGGNVATEVPRVSSACLRQVNDPLLTS